MLIIWFKFILCMLFIVISGYYLSIAADLIAEKKGISKTWIGVTLLAFITSLPELVTSISAVDLPDLAVGDLFGSNTINIFILAVMDFLSRERPLLEIVNTGHILNACFGLFVTEIAMCAIMLRAAFNDSISFGNVGIESIIIIITYFIGMRLIFTYETAVSADSQTNMGNTCQEPSSLALTKNYKNKISDIFRLLSNLLSHKNKKTSSNPEQETSTLRNGESLYKEYIIILLSAPLVIGSGIWLAHIGNEIVLFTGWGGTFVGSLFLACATSLPELIVCLSAIKIKSFDLGVGNMLGSCLFNISIIPVLDIIYKKHTILSVVSYDHILTSALFIIMTSIICIGITLRSKKSFETIGYEKWMIGICYIVGSYLLFKISTR